MMSGSSVIGVAALAVILAGCAAGGSGGGSATDGDEIVVTLDTSVPDLAAATAVAERDCTARRREAYLLTAPPASGAAGPRTSPAA